MVFSNLRSKVGIIASNRNEKIPNPEKSRLYKRVFHFIKAKLRISTYHLYWFNAFINAEYCPCAEALACT